jgi:glycosyltransferase involved in cell wall biosynthesis
VREARQEDSLQPVVMVPALNEGPRLGALLSGVRAALPDAPVWVVDGGSDDDTAAVARHHDAIVLRQQGRGYAAALRTGYRVAAAQGVQRLVQLDADGQHPPEALPQVVAALGQADLVIASRHGTRSPGGWGRRLGNGALYLAVAGVAAWRGLPGRAPRDVTSGMQALGPRALRALALAMPDDIADANMRVLALRLGLTVAELPVTMASRTGGRSMHDGLAGARNLARSLRAVARDATRELT